jgi:hypothetical protein
MKLSKLLPNLTPRSWLYSLAIFAVGVSISAAILMVGIPDKLNQILVADDSTFLFLVSFFLLYLAYRPTGWLGSLTSFSGTLILFALQLSGIWRSGLNQSNYILAGLLTMTDTEGYYNSALRLLEGDTFSVFSSMRPLSQGVLATLLGLTGQNLQLTFAIQTLLTAIACYLLAREVQSSHGRGAGVLVIISLFLFYRKYLGTTSTENLGLALGAIAMAFFWRGIVKERINPCLLGILLLTLALNTRAGAFFILPALILWGTWSFRGSSRFSMHFLIGGASMVLLGFILNSLVLKMVGSPNALAYSNFSTSLYGLVAGGNWLTVTTKYPELLAIEEPERSRRIYGLALEIIRANPLSLVRGCLRAWTDFLWHDFIFSFVTSTKVNVVLQLLSLVAIVKCFQQRLSLMGSFVLAATLGILVSVPFVPPWDAGIRPYAATIPFLVLLPAIGLAAIAHKTQWRQLVQVSLPQESSQILAVFGISLVLLTVVGPIATAFLTQPPQLAAISCPADQEVVYFRSSPGSSINLVADNAVRKTYIPNIRISDFRRMLQRYLDKDFRIPELTKELTQLTENTVIFNKIDIKTNNTLWAIASKKIIPRQTGIIGACGRRTANPGAKKPNDADGAYLRSLFYAESMTLLSR